MIFNIIDIIKTGDPKSPPGLDEDGEIINKSGTEQNSTKAI